MTLFAEKDKQPEREIIKIIFACPFLPFVDTTHDDKPVSQYEVQCRTVMAVWIIFDFGD